MKVFEFQLPSAGALSGPALHHTIAVRVEEKAFSMFSKDMSTELSVLQSLVDSEFHDIWTFTSRSLSRGRSPNDSRI